MNNRKTGRNLFSRTFDLRPDELLKFKLLFLHSFFLGFFIAVYFVPANSIFIKNYGIEYLPIAYIVSGIVGYIVSSIYSSLQKKVKSKNLFFGTILLMLIITLASRILLPWISEEYISFFVFIWAWPFISLVGIEAGGLAVRFLNLIQVKRLFGLINMGGVIASILGYLLIPFLMSFISHPYDLLYVGVFFILASIVVLFVLYNKVPENTTQESVYSGKGKNTSFRELFKERYFVLIFISATISMTVVYITDFGFLATIKAQKDILQDSQSLSQFLALVYGGLKIGEMLISYFSSRILSKYGIKLGLIILPIFSTGLILLAAVLGLLDGTSTIAFLAVMTINKSMERILRRGLDDPAFNVLYQPLPSSQKLDIQAKVGIVIQLSTGVAGILLIFSNYILQSTEGFQLKYFSFFFLPLLIFWVFIAIKLYESYKQKLKQILTDLTKKKDRDVSRNLYGDEFLVKKLKKFNENVVSLSVSILSETKSSKLEHYASSILERSGSDIRKIILHSIDPTWRKRVLQSVERIADKAESESEKELIQEAFVLLDSTKINAITDEKFELLKKMATYEDKLTLLKILDKKKIENSEILIDKLLDDDDRQIKIAAIHLAAKKKDPALNKKLVDLMASRNYSHTSGEALLGIGDKIIPELEKYFATDTANEILLRILEIYAKIGSTVAKKTLVNHLNHSSKEIRFATIRALNYCRYQAKTEELPFIDEKLQEIVQNIMWIYASISDIEDSKNTLKLYQSLDLYRELHFEAIFNVLSFMYNPRMISLIRKNIIGKNTIFAMEIIDNFISQDIKQYIVPLFDDISVNQKIRKLGHYFPQKKLNLTERLKEIIIYGDEIVDNWTVAKAVELLGKIHKKKKTKTVSYNDNRYESIEKWTPDNVLQTLNRIRRSEISDEIFVCLFHSQELVYSSAAKVVFDENPIRCFDYLENMSEEKQSLIPILKNKEYLVSDRIKLIKRLPIFFNIPENLLVNLAQKVKVVLLEKDKSISIIPKEGEEQIIVVLNGSLTCKFDNSLVFKRNQIITRSHRKHADELIANKRSLLLSVNRADYFNVLIDDISIIRYIFDDLAV